MLMSTVKSAWNLPTPMMAPVIGSIIDSPMLRTAERPSDVDMLGSNIGDAALMDAACSLAFFNSD
jgi:hypothetical protein